MILKSILILIIYIKIIQTESNNQGNKVPWFIDSESLYYIETTPNFTSKEAQRECLDKEMMYTITAPQATYIVAPSIVQIYGKTPTFWTYDNHLRATLPSLYSTTKKPANTMDQCYKLDASDGIYHSESCSTRMGFICQGKIAGATVYYKNHTSHEIGSNDVQTLCDPQSNDYDDILEMCMIHFKQNRRLL